MPGCYRVAIVAAILVSSAHGQGIPVQPRTLIPTDNRAADLPPFASEAHPQCDGAGNIYFHLWSSDGSLANLMRLSPDEKEGLLVGLPDEYARAGLVTFTDYSVTPNGEVQMLAGVQPQLYVFHFDSDGKFDKAVPVETPKEGAVISNIVAFQNGASLLIGNYNGGAPPQLKGKSYLATVDPSGKQSPVVQTRLPNVDLNVEDFSPGTASGEDGNAYFLSGDYVWVLSQTGEVVRRIHFHKPDPQDVPVNVRVSANWAVIDLATPPPPVDHPGAAREAQPFAFRFLLVDAISGDTVGLYELPKELRTLDEVCFSRQQGLTFMTRDKGKTAFFNASF